MAPDSEPSEEGERIDFLLRRDGYEATRAWVDRTLNLYRQAIAHPGSMAAEPHYRPRFERSIHEFEAWLSAHQPRNVEQGGQDISSRAPG